MRSTNPMKKQLLLLAAVAALVSLPVESFAADVGRKKSAFSKADTDGDGKVTQAEFVAAAKGKRGESKAADAFARLDKNKDGSLTTEEFKGGDNAKTEAAKTDAPKTDSATATTDKPAGKRRKPAN